MDVSQPFKFTLKEIAESHPDKKDKLLDRLKRVNAVLADFAREIEGVHLDKLPILAVCDPNKNINADFKNYIERRNSPRDKDPVKTHLKRLIEALPWEDSTSNNENEDQMESSLPEFMRPLWPLLPKKWGALTLTGRTILTILLRVADINKVSSYKTLFLELSDSVTFEIRDNYNSDRWASLDTMIITLRRKLGLTLRPKKKGALAFERWPPTLKKQWLIFEEQALNGPSDGIALMGRQNKYKFKKLRKSSIDNLRKHLAKALSIIPLSADLSLEDLLRLKRLKVSENGNRCYKEANSLVDAFRESERKLVTNHKRCGYDSSSFSQFIDALCCVAVYNGFFLLRKSFKEAYRVSLDLESKQKIKAQKKKAYSRDFIDGHITTLRERFLQIVKLGTFKSNRKDMRFCMFYVIFITLRHMGFRQELLRQCALGSNLILGKNARTLTFEWPPELVKNNRHIYIPLDRKVDQAFELVFEAISTFIYRVYPYLQGAQAENLEGQLFVKMTRGGRFARFKNHSDFNVFFGNATKAFLPLKGLVPGRKGGINPHFLRGFATDWLLDYGLSYAQVADLIGISEVTLRREYEDPHRRRSARPALNKIQEESERQQRLFGEGDVDTKEKEIIKSYQRMLELKDKELNRSLDELNSVIKKSGHLEAERDSYRIKNECLLLENSRLKENLSHEIIAETKLEQDIT
jgi:hypothetical protein